MKSRLMVLGCLLIAAKTAFADPEEQAGAPQPVVGQRAFGRNRGGDALARAGLKAGARLPDVAAYDAAGKEFKLRSLRGHYAVLVFGCLT